jgi:hypothetical protein
VITDYSNTQKTLIPKYIGFFRTSSIDVVCGKLIKKTINYSFWSGF